MAGFCKECFYKLKIGNSTDMVSLTDNVELCEGCKQYKRIVDNVIEKSNNKIDFTFDNIDIEEF